MNNIITIFDTIAQKIKEFGLIQDLLTLTDLGEDFLSLMKNKHNCLQMYKFEGIEIEGLRVSGSLSPKILVVKPGAHL
jgi:hypothetical protein